MLYDQGQLLQSYADAYVATKDPIFLEVIEDIAGYVTRDLRHKVFFPELSFQYKCLEYRLMSILFAGRWFLQCGGR